MDFTHLHLHSDYSLLDGACKIERMIDKVTGQRDLHFVRRLLARYDADLQVVGTELHASPRSQAQRTTIEEGTRITCTLPHLPLRPGRYPITLYLDRGGEIIDRIDNQVDFTVLPSDFYGTGQLPSESQGAFMLAHEWRVENDSRRLNEASTLRAP